VILKIGTKDPVPMRMLRQDLPQELDNIVLRALLRDRTRRFSNLDELSRALMPFAPGARLRDTADGSVSSASLQPVREPLSHSGAMPISSSGNSAPALSLRGNAPELPVSPSMLGAAVSLDGVIAARATPVSGPVPQRGRVVWAVVAALLIGLVGGGSWLLLREGAAAVADGAAQKAPAASNSEQAGAAAPAAAAAPVAPVAALPAGTGSKLEPELAEPAELPADALEMQKSSDSNANEVIMEPAQAVGSAPADRSKRARVQPNVKARPVKLIPGDRTKGLSVDEF
jgi:hypothetical protein